MTLDPLWENSRPKPADVLAGVVILVVEDCEDVRDVVAAQLRSAGATVLETGSAREALAWAWSGTDFQILLTDQNLQDELSGADLARDLCLQRPGLRVTVMSGQVDDVLMSKVRAEWCVLSKPVTKEELISTVSSLVAR